MGFPAMTAEHGDTERDAAPAEQDSPGPQTPELVGAAIGAVLVEAPARSLTDVETADGQLRGRSRPSPVVPTRVGRYAILRPIGEGGMGVVLEAFDPELDRKVAIKLLQPSRVGSQASQRLLREAQVMARLSHPNVVQVYDAGVAEHRVFLAMELVRGTTVRSWLDAAPREWPEILAVFVAAGRGLAAAHAVGIIHRDFKPENILVADDVAHADRRVLVADFGLANYDARVAEPPREARVATLTATGAIVGTPVYMAPEQHAGLPLDAAADQFSFCVALHEALFGQRPFAGTSAVELAANVCEGRYVAPAEPRRAPRWLTDAIRRGLAVDPRARYPGFTELLAALARDPSRRRRRGLATIAAAGALVLGGWALATRDAPCSGAAEHIGAVWNEDARGRVRAAFAGAPVATNVVDALDRYAGAWAVAHREMCEAHEDGAFSARLLDDAMACLDRREAALARLVDVVAGGGHEVIASAPLAAIGLPAIASCTDRAALAQSVAAPTDAATAQAVAALRRRLTEAEVVHRAAGAAPAQVELAAIGEEARTLDHPPLSAELALVEGRLAIDRGEWPVAATRLAEAAAIGVGAGLDRVAAEALARKLFVDGMLSPTPAEVLTGAPLVDGLVRRTGDPPELAAMLANGTGVLQAQAMQRADAAASFARAVRLAEQAPEVNAADLAGYRINLAVATADEAERDALLVRAADELRVALGDDHPKLFDIARRRGEYASEPRRAIELLAPVCAALPVRLPGDPLGCHVCAWRLAELHDELGEPSEALAAARASASCLATEPSESDREYVQARRAAAAGLVALLQGDAALALVELARARRELAPHRELPWIAVDLAGVTLLEARAELALGHDPELPRAGLAEAIATFDRQLASYDDPALRARRAAAVRLADAPR